MERWQAIAISAVRHFRKRTAHWSLHDVEIDDVMQQAVAETLAVLRAHPDTTDAYAVWLVSRKLMSYVLRNVWDVPSVSLTAAHHIAAQNDNDDDTDELQQLIARLARAGRVKGGARGQRAITQTIRVLEFLADGYSITRIAELMHLTPSAVRQIIARLRERLEAEYVQHIEGESYVTQRHCHCAFHRNRSRGVQL